MNNYVSEVARNHFRVLNHSSLLVEKLDIGKQLGLLTAKAKPEFSATVEHILQSSEYSCLVEKLLPIGLLEVHPTDVCNANCSNCYYYQRQNETLPLTTLCEALSMLAPRGIVLVGGGEPTVYHDKSSGADFNTLVLALKGILPRTEIGLITNGIKIPKGSWINQIDWVRISLDSGTAETYRSIKNRNVFAKVVSNIETYLASDIPHIGVVFCLAGLILMRRLHFLDY